MNEYPWLSGYPLYLLGNYQMLLPIQPAMNLLNTTIVDENNIKTTNIGNGNGTVGKIKLAKQKGITKNNAWQVLAERNGFFTPEGKADVASYMGQKGGWFNMTKASNPFSKGNIKSGASSALLGTAATLAGGLGYKGFSEGYDSGAGQAINKYGSMIGSAVGLFNPIAGAIVTAGSGILGGLTNRFVGLKTNKEAQKTYKANLARGLAYRGNASSFDNVQEAPIMQSHANVYKGGHWSHRKANRKNAAIASAENYAGNYARGQMLNNIATLNHKQSNNMLANYSAFGGPMFGGINGPSDYQFMNLYLANMSQRNEFNNKPSLMPNSFMNMGAFGGTLLTDGAAWPTGLIKVGKGGTHEENPKGGVTVGADDQGVPNMVELNETIGQTKMSRGKQVKDYVFSDRLTVPLYSKEYKEGGQMPYEMKALKKYEGKTFAKASEMLEKDSGVNERPNDVMALNMFAEGGDLLRQAQEKERQKEQLKELMKAIDQMTPELLEQFQQLLAMMLQGQMLLPSQEEQMAMLQLMTPEDLAAMLQLAIPLEAMVQLPVPLDQMVMMQPTPEQEAIALQYQGGFSGEPDVTMQGLPEYVEQQALGGNLYGGGGKLISKTNFNKLGLNLSWKEFNELNELDAANYLMYYSGSDLRDLLSRGATDAVIKAFNNLNEEDKQKYNSFLTMIKTANNPSPIDLGSYIRDVRIMNVGNSIGRGTEFKEPLYNKNGDIKETSTQKPQTPEQVVESLGNASTALKYEGTTWLDDLAKEYAAAKKQKDANTRTWGSFSDRNDIYKWARGQVRKNEDFRNKFGINDLNDFNNKFNEKVNSYDSFYKDYDEKYGKYHTDINTFKTDVISGMSEEDAKKFAKFVFLDNFSWDKDKTLDENKEALFKKMSQVQGYNNTAALRDAITKYNETLNTETPDFLKLIEDINNLAYNRQYQLGDFENWNYGPHVNEVKVIKRPNGKYAIQQWEDAKDNKIHMEDNQIYDNLAAYELSDNYLDPRIELANRYLKASKELGFDRDEFMKKDPLWNTYIESMKKAHKDNANYWNDFGSKFTLESLFGTNDPAKLELLLSDKQALINYLKSEEGIKNTLDSYWFDKKAGVAHGMAAKGATGNGSRKAFFTVDNDGKRTYYNWMDLDDKQKRLVELVGDPFKDEQLSDGDDVTTLQQIRFKGVGNPLKWDLYDKAMDMFKNAKVGSKYNSNYRLQDEIDKAPYMPLWPYLAGMGLLGYALALNLFNPLDTSDFEDMINYSKTSHYKPVYATPIPGYLAYNPTDRNHMINQLRAQGNAGIRHAMNNTGANPGMALAAVTNMNNNLLNTMGDYDIKASQNDQQMRNAVFEANSKVNQYLSENALAAAKADSDAYSKAGNESIAGLSAAYKMKADAEKDKGTAISSGLSGMAGLLNNYAQQNWLNQWQNWAALRNIYGPGILYAHMGLNTTAQGGPIRKKRRSLI